MKSESTMVGKSVPMMDAFDKVTGKATYVADIVLPDMLHAKVAGSLYPHAIVKKINIKQIESMPGVKAVLTKKDLPDKLFGSIFTRPSYPINDHARCVGDVIAAVAAETEEAAENAIEQMDVEYDVMPAVFDPDEAIKSSAPKLFPEGNVTDSEGKPQVLEWGDVEKGFKEASFTVEGTFKMSQVLHAAMEPRACIANWEKDKLLLWATTQTPHQLRRFLAEYFGIPLDNVTIRVCTFGGGFGGKYYEEYILTTSLLARKCGRPVKLVYTRDMESMIGRRRWGAVTQARIGVKQDGTITAIDMKQHFDVGAYGVPDGGSGTTFGAVNAAIYRTKNCRMIAQNIATNSATAQKLRSVYVPTYRFSVEQLMDKIEERLGKEPGELRLDKNIKPGEKLMPYGNIMDNHAMDICLKKAKEVAGWSNKWKGWKKPVSIVGLKHRGIGIGFGTGWCDWYREEHKGTIMELHPDGEVVLTTGVTDIGTGNLTAISQIVAEVLGIPSVGNIEVKSPNTPGTEGDMPFDFGTVASRTLFVGGWAAQLAATEVKRKVLELAAAELHLDPSELNIYDNVIFSKKDKQKKVNLKGLITEPVIVRGSLPMPKVVGRAKRYEYYVAPVEIHIAEVEVDIETGEIKVVHFTAAHDVGKAINPQIVKNQICGGVIQGISFALYEELIFDREQNIYLTPDFMDYKIANMSDIPPIDVILVEDAPASFGPFGAKGIGEHPNPPAYGAIANAVYNAIGVRPNELPMRPEKVLKWLYG